MNNFKKKAIPAVLLLAGATASLGGVTYAWFTANAKVSASKINLGVVDSTGGIQISKEKGGIYQQAIDFDSDTKKVVEDSSATTSVYSYPHVLNPRSAAAILSGEKTEDRVLDFYSATIDPNNGENLYSSSKITKENDGYWKLDLYFENTTKFQQKMYFNNYSGSSYDDILKDFFPVNNSAIRSVRIAFVNQGYCDHKDDALTRPDNPSLVVVEPDHLNHFETAYVYTEDAEGKRTEVPYDKDHPEKRKIKQDTWGIKGAITESTPMRPTSKVSTLEKVDTKSISQCTLGSKDEGATELFTLEAGKYTTVSMFVWLEGNDCDCLDAAAGNPIAINLKLEAKQVNPEA